MFEIVVREPESLPGRFTGRFEAWLGGELLGTFRTPLLSAARELQRRGVSENAELVMRHEGSSIVAMRTTVGTAARLTVEERDHGSPRFRPYSVPGMSGGRAPAADCEAEAVG